MKRCGLLFALFLSASACAFGAGPSRIDDPVEGQKLARDLRSVFPSEDGNFNGVLRISRPGSEPRDVPVRMLVDKGNRAWSTEYLAGPTHQTNQPWRETLSIGRSYDGSAPEYVWQRGSNVSKITGDALTNSFVGTDFALLDLGLQFFHWPTQILVTREMRKGRGCDVLESRPAQTNLYSRVLSWIDQESRAQGQPGLIMAEAYGRDGKLLKEFEIKGMKEVAGRWQVREMELRNRQTKGSTRLQFQFDEK